MYRSNELSSDCEGMGAIDAFLAELAHRQIGHLAALLNIVADRLEANKAPENVENVIVLIREELACDG